VTAVGLVLAAGRGRRLGGPKAPHVVAGERLVDRAVRVMTSAGCDPVLVVLGAWVGDVPGAVVVVNDAWDSGLGSSLRAGLAAAAEIDGADRVAVVPVDLPGLTAEAVRRVLTTQGRLVAAGYDGRRGHPVVLGREHWGPVAAAATGDAGARDYLVAHDVVLVDVGDVASDADVDTA
jgi:CTP:molybdopterin cytidylyltransferase MocA